MASKQTPTTVAAAATAETPALPEVPLRKQDLQEVAAVLEKLEESSKNRKSRHTFCAKRTRFNVANSRDGYQLDAWKLLESDYKRRDLPTYARGLFTTQNAQGAPEIAVRGYDKFFNVNEVPETRWDHINECTQGPYEITLKENGCIIFVAGLADDTLVVCSKHSTGERSDVELSHSSAGEKSLEAQLQRIGKTKEELARYLYARNATAVAELCDDSFEEHILAYGPEKAGLYLHGINVNLPDFVTYPSPLVQKFAGEWGFLKIHLITMHDVGEVRKFLEALAETGAYDGRDVEGFVIRCRRSPKPDCLPFRDWFFKYKFEEPYLMYRQWRECTKALISGRALVFKKHKVITEEYLMYARRRIAADPKLGELYTQNHGIIQLRNDFLAYKNIKGSEAANFEDLEGADDNATVTKDVILVPIATLGCGKTTIALALGTLLGYGHVQNDNITGPKRPPRFTRMVLEQLQDHSAVVADRNNAQRHERQQLLTDVKMQHIGARLVALNYVHSDLGKIRRVTQERVFARGDNHQTIQAASNPDKAVGIMENFIRRFEPCDTSRAPDDGFDAVIDLNPAEGSRVNLEKVVRELHRLYPNLVREVPTAEAMDAAIDGAINSYAPNLRHTIPDRGRYNDQKAKGEQQKKTEKKKPLEYMAVQVDAKGVNAHLDRTFENVSPDLSRFYKQLQQTNRIQASFHVTLMHRSNARQRPDLWERYTRLQAEAEAAAEAGGGSTDLSLGSVDVQLERIVFDRRLMTLVVRLISKAPAVDGAEAWESTNRVTHITIGTLDSTVKPRESNDLLGWWLDQGSSADNGIVDIAIEGRPVLAGVVRGVLSR